MLSRNKRTRETQQLAMPAPNPSSDSRRPSTKLSLFVGFSEPSPAPSPWSPRSFDDGAVGLGIVAAMNGSGDSLQARSDPIPIVSATRVASVFKGKPWEEEEEMERSESYTCVISHLGNTTKVYVDHGGGGGRGDDDGVVRNCWGNPVVFFQSPSPPTSVVAKGACPADDFLNYCYLCRKCLHGLDIYIYRGEKAFCSAECRYQQILNDDYREKCGPEVLKSYEHSASPCSAPLIFAAGVAAA